MLRLSKLADYGSQVMAYMARDGVVHSASEVATRLGMAPATVSKILKMLAREPQPSRSARLPPGNPPYSAAQIHRP